MVETVYDNKCYADNEGCSCKYQTGYSHGESMEFKYMKPHWVVLQDNVAMDIVDILGGNTTAQDSQCYVI